MDWITQYWLQAVFGLIVAALGGAYKLLSARVKAILKEHSAIREGMLALIREGIISAYKRCEDRGYCPIYELENVNKLYKEYKKLGGNGTVDELVEDLRDMHKLPPKTADEAAT